MTREEVTSGSILDAGDIFKKQLKLILQEHTE